MSADTDFHKLIWNAEAQCFVGSYEVMSIYMQPSNKCDIHDDLNDCGDVHNDSDATHRIDSETGECMDEGWLYDMGEAYIATQDRAEALCQRLWGQTISEAFDDSEENCDGQAFFYTEWH